MVLTYTTQLHGQIDNVQNVVYNLYSYLRYFGITALEFDSLGLTVDEFDNKELTARNFDLYGKNEILVDFNRNMFSPFTGEITPLSVVINQLANFHKEPITAQQFDELQLTTENFDNKNLSAYQFDWEGKTLLTIKKKG